jgi:hypothetical protein
MVLFDFPSDTENGINYSSGFGISTGQTYWDSNPVWCVLLDCLLNHDISGGGGGGKKKKGGRKLCERDRVMRQQCRECYMADRAVWGVHVGSHPVMIRYTPISSHFRVFDGSPNDLPCIVLSKFFTLYLVLMPHRYIFSYLLSTLLFSFLPASILTSLYTTPPHSSPPLILQC